MQKIKEMQDHAIDLRNRGYNCAQCVLMALSKHIGIDEKFAARISAAYGTGFGGSGQMCGAISVLGIAEGLMTPGSEPHDKADAMWRIKDLFDKFKEENNDRFLCPDLKGKEDTRKCPDLIKEAIELFMKEHPNPAKRKGLLERMLS